MYTRLLQTQWRSLARSSRRPYYADILSSVPPIKARIVETEDGVKLETYERYGLYRFCDALYSVGGYVDSNTGRAPALASALAVNVDVHTWEARVAIQPGGHIESWVNFSSDYYRRLVKKNEHDGTLLPDLLYAIPQAVWDAFIAKLQHQDVVASLNLSKHRHLVWSYNFAISGANDLCKMRRADFVRRCHFFNSYWKTYGEPFDQWKPGQNYVVINGERIAFMWVIFKGYKELIEHIDQGKDIITTMKDCIPSMTPIFFNKFAHCPSFIDAQKIGERLVLPRAIMKDGVSINKQILDEMIAALPSSKQSPHEFAKMIDDGREIQEYMIRRSTRAASNIFYRQRNHFGQFKQLGLDTLGLERSPLIDYLQAIVKDLIYPQCVRILPKNSEASDKFIQCINVFFDQLFSRFLCGSTDAVQITKLNSLQERWHRNVTIIDSMKPKEINDREWHALFEAQTIDDVTFRCLTTVQQLKDEGREMQHCVGGYASGCSTGRVHIISVKTTSGDRSTLEINVTKRMDGTDLIALNQNRTTRNDKACDEIIRATNQLLAKMNAKEITLNQQRGSTAPTSTQPSVVHQYYPYQFENEETQEQIYQAYKNTKTLPSFMIANSYREMLEKNPSILEMIDDLISSYVTKNSATTVSHSRW